MIASQSKLRSKIKGYTGIDILTDSGAYKSTYEILLEISKVWDDLTDMDRAGLLEMIAGKTRSNTAAAILSNSKDLEEAYKSAMEAEGSALAENEKYLDSIQGRIDLFTNSVQTMWSDTLDSDAIKWFVDVGTQLVKWVDNLGLIKTLVMAIGTFLIQKHFKGDLFGGLFGENISDMKSYLKVFKNEYEKAVNDFGGDSKEANKKKKQYEKYNTKVSPYIEEYDKLSEDLKVYQTELTNTENALKTVNEKIGSRIANGEDPFKEDISQQKKLQEEYDKSKKKVGETKDKLKNVEDQANKSGAAGIVAGNKIKTGFKNAGKAVLKFGKEMLKSMAYTMAITAVFEVIGNIGNALAPLFENMDNSAEALQEKLDELRSELSSVESELKSLQSELKDTDERIEELMSQGSLTFVEQEELNKLKSASEELKAQISLQENLKKSMQQGVNSASIEATNAYLDTSFMSEKSKSERQEKGKEEGEGIGQIIGTALGAIGFFGGPMLGAALMAVGSSLGSTIGGWIGEGVVGAVYDSEQSVGEAMDSMLVQRGKLLQDQKDALASGDAEAYNEATEALRTYDSQMANHISQIQQNYNAMDWDTASPEDRKEMMEYADWLDKYNISMGTADAKSSAIARIFGDEAQGNIAKARDEINRLKKNLTEAKNKGEGVDEALAALEGFKLNLSEEETKRLHDMGIYLYEVENYFKDVVETESEFVDNDLEDVANDINKITDGLDSLKSAFDEVVEEGVLTAKTILSIKESLGIGDSTKETEELTAAWSDYLKVMMSGTATTEEMVGATERLTQAWIEDALANNNLTPDTKMEYVAQLRILGVDNAEEYVDGLLQKNMVKDLENSFVIDKEKVRRAFPARTFDTFSDDKIKELANQYGILAEISDEAKKDIMDRYGIEENAIDNIIEKINEKAKFEKQIYDEQVKQGTYNDWYGGKDGKKGFAALYEELKTYQKVANEYSEFSKDAKTFNPNEWKHWNNRGQEFYAPVGGGQNITPEEFNKRKADAEAYQKWMEQNFEKYNKYIELKEQYDTLLKQGIANEWVEVNEKTGDVTILNQEFQKNIDTWNNDIKKLEGEMQKEVNAEIQLKLELQNKSELVDDIQNVFDNLKDAVKEYNESGGVSADTLQTLLFLEPKYLGLLYDEEGQLKLNQQAIFDVATARIRDMGLQKAQNTIDAVENALKEDKIEKAYELTTANYGLAESTWDVVDSRMAEVSALMAEKGMSQASITAFQNSINAIKTMTESTVNDLPNLLSSSGNTKKQEAEDAFQKAMDYWENRIGAEQSRFEQVQNEIDLLEKQGKVAGKGYYDEQIASENRRLSLLQQQKAEAKKYLGQFKEGSDEWWDAANQLNDIEGEIDDVTLSIQDLRDAQAEVDWKVFDEATDRFGKLHDELDTIRELIAQNGEEDWFDDEGMFTDKGTAYLASYITDLQFYEGELVKVNEKLKEYSLPYAGHEEEYKKLGIDSEQELYDAREKLIDQQYDIRKAQSDTQQSVADMYESQIDAVEEYTNKLVDSYNDYIDVVKEALDAERD